MDRLTQRLEVARQALGTLNELAQLETPTRVERDAAIQRFEYSFEAVWKAAQMHLKQAEGVEANSPKAVVRASAGVGLLDESQARLALAMADDRNLTAHTYNEKLAIVLFARLHGYAELMGAWLNAIVARTET